MESKAQLRLINNEQSLIKNSQNPEINDSKVTITDHYKSLSLEELEFKRSILLSCANNPLTEADFRRISLLYKENSLSSQEFNEFYCEYSKIYHQRTSLYTFKTGESWTNLVIFDTEHEREELKKLKNSEPFDWGASIAQLPNGQLFCYGRFFPPSGITLIIDNDYNIHILPSGTPCYLAAVIYFENCVYCFGGDKQNTKLTISSKFSFDENRWIALTLMPSIKRFPAIYSSVQTITELSCNSVLFDRKILISGYRNEYLLLYSIDIDSFSTIPYKFAEDNVKILINIEERLYLIECDNNGSIYESEIGGYYNWNKVISLYSNNENLEVNAINFWLIAAVYCSYNKGKIYIGLSDDSYIAEYFMFNLNDKVVTKCEKIA